MAEFHSLFYRIYSIPIDIEAISKKRNKIHQIAKENRYIRKTITTIENKIKYKQYISETITQKNMIDNKIEWATFTYKSKPVKNRTKLFDIDIKAFL